MVNMAQRITQLRNEKNMGCMALAAELGFPGKSIEKFEAGRLTPTKEQQEKMAKYFGVSVEYLRGESDDPTTMDSWLSGNLPVEEAPKVPTRETARIVAETSRKKEADDSAMFSLLLKSETFQKAVLEVLKTPEGKELIRKAMGK